MSLLSIVTAACGRIGIVAPTIVGASTDLQYIQLLALLNEEAEELASGVSVGLSYDWTALQTQATFTSVATSSQGAIATIAPGFKSMIKQTIWNRSTRLPAYGSLDPEQWQAYSAWGVGSPYPQFRIQGGNLLLLPIPTAGQSYYFEYQSRNSVLAADGATTKSAFTVDTDTSRLDEALLTSGLVWRWKQAKGLEYAEDFGKYQRRVNVAIGRDGAKPDLNMSGEQGFQAGVIVPIGSWNH